MVHDSRTDEICKASVLAAHWRYRFAIRAAAFVGQSGTRQRRTSMSSSAVAVAARAAVASAICVGAINARARLRDERSGRFAFVEARGESDGDVLTQVRTFRSYPPSSERRTPTEAFDDIAPRFPSTSAYTRYPRVITSSSPTPPPEGVSLTSVPASACSSSPAPSLTWARRAPSRRSARFSRRSPS